MISAWPRIVAWLLLLGGCALLLMARLQFSYDLGLFLPSPETPAQKVLIERLGTGPASRFMFLGLASEGSHSLDAERVATIADALRSSPEFNRVLSEPPEADLEQIPTPVFDNRYLLSEERLSGQKLIDELRLRAAQYALFAGEEFNYLLRHDPTHASIDLLSRLAATRGSGGAWQTPENESVLLIETAAPAFDVAAQERAVAAIDTVLASESDLHVTLTGVGAFSASLKETIRSEAEWRSLWASLGLIAVLLIAYRQLRVILLAAMPLLSGALVGLTAVAVLFDEVHGITLAFGFTLLGVAIDYPLHLLSHSRTQWATKAMRGIWPTMRLGLLSTLLAYLAIAFSGAVGLAQLGVFTAVGLALSAAVTRWLLPPLTAHKRLQESEGPAPATVLRLTPLVLLLTGSAVLLLWQWGKPVWNNDLAALSPVPAELLTKDQSFRDAVGTPEMRYVVALSEADLQAVLRATEKLDQALAKSSHSHGLEGWQAVTLLLPSRETWERRRDALPGPQTLSSWIEEAAAGTPFKAQALEPFAQAVAQSRQREPLTLDDFSDSPMRGWIDNQLYFNGQNWISLVTLFGVKQPAQLSQWLSQYREGSGGNAMLVDFKGASESLVADYRGHTLKVLLIALVLILMLLSWRTRMARSLWCLATVMGSVVFSALCLWTLGGPLNLYHMMALLLVAGLGLDYALFLSRPETLLQGQRDTRHALYACAASTIVAFGVLGLSGIPALNALGSTVALGSAICLLTARLGARVRYRTR